MKIAVDLDGVAFSKEVGEFFKDLVISMQEIGHEVGILSARNFSMAAEWLLVWYNAGFPEPDFWIFKTDDEKKIYKPTKENNGKWKADMVDMFDIDILFDDLDNNEDYIKYFVERHPGKLFRVYNE
jgi:hypothetical protein